MSTVDNKNSVSIYNVGDIIRYDVKKSFILRRDLSKYWICTSVGYHPGLNYYIGYGISTEKLNAPNTVVFKFDSHISSIANKEFYYAGGDHNILSSSLPRDKEYIGTLSIEDITNILLKIQKIKYNLDFKNIIRNKDGIVYLTRNGLYDEYWLPIRVDYKNNTARCFKFNAKNNYLSDRDNSTIENLAKMEIAGRITWDMYEFAIRAWNNRISFFGNRLLIDIKNVDTNMEFKYSIPRGDK